MGMAELSGHITASLFPLCLRGITTGLTVGDDKYFAREDLLNAYRGSEKKNGFQPYLGKCSGIIQTDKPWGQWAIIFMVL